MRRLSCRNPLLFGFWRKNYVLCWTGENPDSEGERAGFERRVIPQEGPFEPEGESGLLRDFVLRPRTFKGTIAGSGVPES